MECNLRYEYASIEENQIRIIYLQPGSYDDELKCELIVANGNEEISYEALSYCWGNGPIDQELYCAGRLIPISKGLNEALRRIRHERDMKSIWVDQISINQENDAEKSAQVRRMGSTYSKAEQILIWLGEEDKDTASLFDLFLEIYRQIQGFIRQPEIMDIFQKSAAHGTNSFPLRLSSSDSPDWVAFRNFNSRSWFRRTWTFQELVLSRQAILICGAYRIDWLRFSIICEMVDAYDRAYLRGHESHLKETYHYIRYLAMTNTFLRKGRPQHMAAVGINQTGELLNLVKALRQNEASDRKDRLFALRGCATDIDSTILPFIDYSISYEQCYMVFTEWFINRYHDLIVLRLVNITNQSNGLPSWTPDFHVYDQWNNFRHLFGPSIMTHGTDRMYNATGSSTAFVTLNYVPHLELRGIRVGVISRLDLPAGNLQNNIGIGPNVLTGGLWHSTAEEVFRNGVYPPTGEPVKLAYHRLRVGDHITGEKRAQDRRDRPKPLLSLPEPGHVNYSEAIRVVEAERDDISTLILKWTTRQRFFITDTGYMGLAHRSCKEGDLVYLLMGGDTPFILRKEPSGNLKFKGESYVHGIMDGEFLLKQFKLAGDHDSSVSDQDWLASLHQDPLPFETEALIIE